MNELFNGNVSGVEIRGNFFLLLLMIHVISLNDVLKHYMSHCMYERPCCWKDTLAIIVDITT